MTLDQIQVIDIIIKKGSFRAAAEHLNRAQSAISYAVKNFEAELGVEIFDRSSYRPQLTPMGEALLEKGQRLLQQARELEQLGLELSKGVEPSLHLAVEGLYPIEKLIPVLRDFSREQPCTQVKLSIEVMGADFKVQSGEADIAIGGLSYLDQENSKVDYEPLEKVKLIPVVSPDHPMGKVKKEIYQAELLSFVQIILKSTVDEMKDVKAGIPEGSLTWSVPHFSTKKDLLVGGLGWGNMPEHLIREELKNKKLVKLKVKDFKVVQVPLFLMRQSIKAKGPSSKMLWEMLKN